VPASPSWTCTPLLGCPRNQGRLTRHQLPPLTKLQKKPSKKDRLWKKEFKAELAAWDKLFPGLEAKYTRVPNLLIRHTKYLGVTNDELRLLLALLTIRWDCRDIFPKKSTLASYMECGVRQVNKLMLSLEKKGFINVNRTQTGFYTHACGAHCKPKNLKDGTTRLYCSQQGKTVPVYADDRTNTYDLKPLVEKLVALQKELSIETAVQPAIELMTTQTDEELLAKCDQWTREDIINGVQKGEYPNIREGYLFHVKRREREKAEEKEQSYEASRADYEEFKRFKEDPMRFRRGW
jgi:hypothetical protein